MEEEATLEPFFVRRGEEMWNALRYMRSRGLVLLCSRCKGGCFTLNSAQRVRKSKPRSKLPKSYNRVPSGYCGPVGHYHSSRHHFSYKMDGFLNKRLGTLLVLLCYSQRDRISVYLLISLNKIIKSAIYCTNFLMLLRDPNHFTGLF